METGDSVTLWIHLLCLARPMGKGEGAEEAVAWPSEGEAGSDVDDPGRLPACLTHEVSGAGPGRVCAVCCAVCCAQH